VASVVDSSGSAVDWHGDHDEVAARTSVNRRSGRADIHY
jgi:hypothetical protein